MKKRLFGLDPAVIIAASLVTYGGSKITEATTAAPAAELGAVGEITAAGEAAEITEAADGVVKIDGIGPTTGGAAVYGLVAQHGARLAVGKINTAGGTNGAQVESKFEDDEYGAEESVNTYNTLKDWDMQALMGTVTSTPYIAIADKTASDNTFQTIPSGSAIEYVANPNVFHICSSDPDQDVASAKYTGENKLAPRIAVIYDSSDVYSSGIYEEFAEESKSQGLGIVAIGAFTADSNKGLSTQLQKVKDAGVELVFLPIYYTKASLILQQADETRFAPRFFGCDGMDGVLQVQNFDTKLAKGLMLLVPFAADAFDDLTVSLIKSYKDAYNEVPVQSAANVHDTTYVIKAVMEDVGVISDMDVSTICDALETSMLSIKLDGLTGEDITWAEDGEPRKAPEAVRIMDGACTAM